MVHESTPTDFKGTKAFIVDRHSAGPLLPDVQYFGIEATHSGMSKFESKNSPGYTNVSVTLMSWVSHFSLYVQLMADFCQVQESPQVVKTNWEIERIQRKQKKDAEVAAILGYYVSFHPEPPNSC
jgi:predicted secreted Zn-dependent protease